MPEMTQAQMKARIAELEAEKSATLPMKVSEKRAVSVYGLQQYPVTLYWDQWETLFNNVDAIKAFIASNKPNLLSKFESIAAKHGG